MQGGNAVGAVDVQPGDGARALGAMREAGCTLVTTRDVVGGSAA